ncbi:cell division ATP-binding protein FtsE [Bacillus hwajinpoensis]|uniref:Cell division ATP-binding protein FtsE n=1 Tax=Guptibacillus hwajinpoensis TaxID=208199 RepID=A0A845EQD5_9BACL|nr:MULTISPECIES: cell division ATP-binding protein FtsE [Bacillaceae]MCA0991624.1 cell division ATP-binding protein FtsE [Pseudalkalibacillus hwajinpoensis]MYL61952.1 cell division ATP-binding protein FtsE [Pseudalkalibacillus hwajinpoensis]PFG14815.1 cell division transport system ATP-binding protein [Bacillus sp. es.036]
MIEMKDVWKTYNNGIKAINGIDIKIDKGEFVYIVGPSGAGKSTFMRMMYREEKATSGTIVINGKDVGKLKNKHVPKLRREIGVVFQDFKLLPRLTVYENVAFALEVIEESKANTRKRVMETLSLVNLKNKARFLPDELSGGEQQRVSIARAIVNNPHILLTDEPTGNLDPETAWGIMDILDQINNRGTTVIMATHNKDIVNTFRKRVIAIDGGLVTRDEARGEYGYEN